MRCYGLLRLEKRKKSLFEIYRYTPAADINRPRKTTLNCTRAAENENHHGENQNRQVLWDVMACSHWRTERDRCMQTNAADSNSKNCLFEIYRYTPATDISRPRKTTLNCTRAAESENHPGEKKQTGVMRCCYCLLRLEKRKGSLHAD